MLFHRLLRGKCYLFFTSELANQCALKALFICMVYTDRRYERGNFIRCDTDLCLSDSLTIVHPNVEAWAFCNLLEVKRLKIFRRYSDMVNLL